MPSIHPTACVAPEATLADDVIIGPYCIVESGVTLGAGTHLHSHVVIAGRTTLGKNNMVYPFASLGQPPQDLKYAGEESTLTIGDDNTIREYVTMHIGTAGGTKSTSVGNGNLFMALVHIAHDCSIGNHTVLANGATLAGHVQVEDHAIIGGLSAVHQFVRIGAYAMVGGHSGITMDVPPYAIVAGARANLAGVNLVGLRRHGFSRTEIQEIDAAYTDLFFGAEGTLVQRAEKLVQSTKSTYVQGLIDFVKASKRGMTLGEGDA